MKYSTLLLTLLLIIALGLGGCVKHGHKHKHAKHNKHLSFTDKGPCTIYPADENAGPAFCKHGMDEKQ